VVRLSARIHPTAVTLEHVPKALSPNSTISSAPKDFAIFVSIWLWAGGASQSQSQVVFSGWEGHSWKGWRQGGSWHFSEKLVIFPVCPLCALLQGFDEDLQQDGTLLGTFTYDQDGEPIQTFYFQVQTSVMLAEAAPCAPSWQQGSPRRSLCQTRGSDIHPMTQGSFQKGSVRHS
jgi:hypothetical protein